MVCKLAIYSLQVRHIRFTTVIYIKKKKPLAMFAEALLSFYLLLILYLILRKFSKSQLFISVLDIFPFFSIKM